MWELYSIVFTWGIRYLNKHHIWPWLYVFLCMSCPITDSNGLNVLLVQPLKKHQISRSYELYVGLLFSLLSVSISFNGQWSLKTFLLIIKMFHINTQTYTFFCYCCWILFPFYIELFVYRFYIWPVKPWPVLSVDPVKPQNTYLAMCILLFAYLQYISTQYVSLYF